MERFIYVLATIAAFLGLVDFFVPKAELERTQEAIRRVLKNTHELIHPSKLYRWVHHVAGEVLTTMLAFILLGAILTLIGWWGGKITHADDVHFWMAIGLILLFIGAVFLSCRLYSQ